MEIINTQKQETISYNNDVANTVDYSALDENDKSKSTIEDNIFLDDDELLAESGFTEEEMNDLLSSDSDSEEIIDGTIIDHSANKLYSYVANNNEKSYQTNDSTKTMTTYVSYVKTGNEYKIYVKQNVNWTSVPAERFSDLFAINYTNDLRVSEKDNYPDVELHLKYTKDSYSKIGWKYKSPRYKVKTSTTNEDIKFTGESETAYNHKLAVYFSFRFDLPKNVDLNGSSQRYYYVKRETYTNFYVSMEATFDTNNSSLTGTEMQTHYVHQTGTGEFDWGSLTFTTTAPFISYSTKILTRNPTFERGLFNRMYIRFN